MIIPTPEYDPLFAADGVPFRDRMLAYIEREFADLIEVHPDLPSLVELRGVRESVYHRIGSVQIRQLERAG